MEAHWGNFLDEKYCPYDEFVVGFDSKLHDYFDDKVGLHSLKLVCSDRSELLGYDAADGTWQGNSNPCSGGFTKAKAHIQSNQVSESPKQKNAATVCLTQRSISTSIYHHLD